MKENKNDFKPYIPADQVVPEFTEPENIGASEMGPKTPNGRGCCFWQEYAWL